MPCKPVMIVFCALLVIIAVPVSAQTLQSPLVYAGGVESHIYKSDTIILENTVLEDGTPLSQSRRFAAGMSFLYGQYISYFYIPLRYSLSENFEINFSLPYMNKTVSTYEKRGYGDIKLGASASFRLPGLLDSVSALNFTLPTGDEVAQDRGFIIPMGYGGHTISAREAISLKMSDLPLRLFFAVSGVYYARSTLDVDSSSRYIIDDSYSYAAVIGATCYLANFQFQCKVNYLHFPGRKYKYDNSNTGIETSWNDLNDSLSTSDLIPGIKYGFPDNIEGSVLAIIPVYEKPDSAISRSGQRGWKIFLNIEKEFSPSAAEQARPVPRKKK